MPPCLRWGSPCCKTSRHCPSRPSRPPRASNRPRTSARSPDCSGPPSARPGAARSWPACNPASTPRATPRCPRRIFHVGLATYHAQVAPEAFGAHYAGIADLEHRLIASRQQVIAYAQQGVARGQAEVTAYEHHLRQAFATLGIAAASVNRASLPAGLFAVLQPVEAALATLEQQHGILAADATSRAELSELLGALRHDTAESFRHAGTQFAGMVSGLPGDMTLAGMGPGLPDRVPLTDRVTLGRDPRCDVVLPGRDVSQTHLEIVRAGGGFVLRDLVSSSGTFLNGQRVSAPTPIREGDHLRVGATTFALHDGALLPSSEKNNTRITVQGLTKTVTSLDTHQPLNLLDNVSLVIEPKEFVALLGPSGSGKSTFMDAINGRRRATGGRVLVNDDDFYQSYQYYRRAIGYVPQQDIVHTSLTVKQALRFSAKMRLPADTEDAEVEHIVGGVVRKLGLAERGNTRISNLSGGQLKRVSLGVELLSDPSLLFLDEATSGLDAGTEGKMMTLFRQIADDGTTVVCITHNVENVTICNLAVVLVRGPADVLRPAGGDAGVLRRGEDQRRLRRAGDPAGGGLGAAVRGVGVVPAVRRQPPARSRPPACPAAGRRPRRRRSRGCRRSRRPTARRRSRPAGAGAPRRNSAPDATHARPGRISCGSSRCCGSGMRSSRSRTRRTSSSCSRRRRSSRF